MTEFTRIIGKAEFVTPYITHKTEAVESKEYVKNEMSFVCLVL